MAVSVSNTAVSGTVVGAKPAGYVVDASPVLPPVQNQSMWDLQGLSIYVWSYVVTSSLLLPILAIVQHKVHQV